MKKTVSILLMVVIMASCICVNAHSDVKVTLDGNEIYFPDAKPFIDERNRVLVPIRFVSEAPGALVDWENETKTVVIKQGNDEIRYTVYQPMAYLNGEMMVMDTYGILKDCRTLVPIIFISELLGCTVVWDEKTSTVVITSPKDVVDFPAPEISVNYPKSISDKRLLWIDILNFRDFERSGDYEFKIEFLNPMQFNTYEQDEGAINGWQKYSRCNFESASNSYKTIYSINRAFYTIREDMKTYKPNEGDEITFILTVRNKTTKEIKEYIFAETLKFPFDIEKYSELMEELNMTYNTINTNNLQPEMDFEEIQKDLAKFKNHAPKREVDAAKLLRYMDKLERLITDENYPELEYIAECFMCAIRDIMANVKQESKKKILIKCADSMGIMVQKTNDVLEVTLPMILPTKAKAKAEYLFEPLFFEMENFAKSEEVFINEKAMMCIEFVYDKNNKNIRRGDHDNKEVKQVIDAISSFVVPDDSDNYLSLCQISSEGENNHTKVYVMPERCFGTFFSDHNKNA